MEEKKPVSAPHGGHGPIGKDGKPLPSPQEQKLSVLHKGACSSPRTGDCPCPRECILHGRCCDCVRHHIEERRLMSENLDGYDTVGTKWLPECLRLVQNCEFAKIPNL